MLEALAATILLQWLICPIVVAVCAPKYTVENDGKDGAFELADANTLAVVDMSDFCRPLHAQVHGGERWHGQHV